jgi:tRNA (Thr-GGU) A37 N-methylase
LYAFHKSSGVTLHAKPFLDDGEHRIFALCYPYRSNPIGVSTVRFLSRQDNLLVTEAYETRSKK